MDRLDVQVISLEPFLSHSEIPLFSSRLFSMSCDYMYVGVYA
jgi:hypothetical protein